MDELWQIICDIDLGKVLQRVLRFLHLTPLSLAEKCRIMFGAAVLFSLVIAC